MVDRTYDWNGRAGVPISFPHLTDQQMAGTVRMLMRHDLGHEGIVCGARDRIMCLVKEKAALEARVAELEAWTPAPAPHVVGGLWDQLIVLSGYYITQPPTPDHDFVQVCNGDLRKMVELMNVSGEGNANG